MKLLPPLALLVVVLALVPALFAQQDDIASALRISLVEFKMLINTANPVVLDVRGADTYKAGHIPGAISMPLAELASRWKELPNDRPVITYCS